jgi:hypothetical protein
MASARALWEKHGMARRITLHSPLAPVALATRLKEAFGGEHARLKAGVTGRGTDRTMMLTVYRPNIRNSFQTNLTATMAADGSGTTITGRIGTPTSGIVFMVFWFGFLGLFLIVSLVGLLTSGDAGEMWPMVAVPLGMMGFGWLLWTLGTWTDQADQAAILTFLSDTVQAREA